VEGMLWKNALRHVKTSWFNSRNFRTNTSYRKKWDNTAARYGKIQKKSIYPLEITFPGPHRKQYTEYELGQEG